MSEKEMKATEDKGPPKSKIKFIEDCFGDGLNGHDTYDFKAGKTYELPLTSCRRWVRRNKAEYVGAEPMESATVDRRPRPRTTPTLRQRIMPKAAPVEAEGTTDAKPGSLN